ncbi:uncharacterized protein LOC143376577 [Andrena cerasifolii]|uniref:uncharacterized protein LOC143376577 n=1 Tax=Andrena cerasifolii TaxID=2819439 RepID=UPI004037A148
MFSTILRSAMGYLSVLLTVSADLRLAIGWNRMNLQLVGIWPEPTATSDASSICTALIVGAWLALFVTLPQVTNLFMVNGDMNEITQTLCVAIIPSVNTILKIFITSYYREGLKPLVKCFYDDWSRSKTEEERTIMLTAAKLPRFISIACSMLTHMLVTVFVSVRAFTIYTCDRDQESENHLVLYHGYFPYNVRPTLSLVMTNVGQVVAAYCSSLSYTSVDAFIAMLVLHTCSQFENLRMKLEGLMGEKNGSKTMGQVQKELVWIVKRHEHLNWMASKIEEYFNKLLLIQVLLGTIEICFQGFLFLNFAIYNEDGIWNFQLVFFVLFVSFVVVHIYIYCYVGEMLLVQSNGMANSAYNSTWFNVSCQEAKCLLFIMNRSIRPLRLTAGKFSTFSIDMFSTILRTAMGYLSVLLTISVWPVCIVCTDLRLAIGWNRLNLKLCGIWPEPTPTEQGSSSYAALIPCLCVATFIVVPQSTNLFMLNGDLNEITNNLCLANIPAFNSIVKILITWYYQEGKARLGIIHRPRSPTNLLSVLKGLKPLVKCFYDDWRGTKTEKERTAMISSAKMSRFISTWCTVLTQTMVTAYLSLRAFTIYTCDRDQEAQDRLVLYPGYFPYNVRPTLILVVTNVGQVVAAYCATISYTCVDAFIAMLVLHTCSQFENLRMKLEGLMGEKNGSKTMGQVQKELVWIVKRHEHLNWVARKIEQYFNILLLIQILLCTVEICFQGFLFFNVMLQNEDGIWNFQLVFFVLFVTFIVVHMYIYCYIGEMLLVQASIASGLEQLLHYRNMFQSNGMGISAYKSTWFNVSYQEARCLLLIMNRSIRPLRLTAGKFSTFSMELFSTSVDQDQEDVPIVGLAFFIIHVIYTMLHLFIYCYVGEALLGQSTGIGQSAYDCDWYDLPPKQAVSLIIIICRARISFQITAGKFSPFSLELFNAVLKTSAGYLSVLLAMKD